ncbi:hypothetical protein J3B02_006484, partial [Coemansia erecta]
HPGLYSHTMVVQVDNTDDQDDEDTDGDSNNDSQNGSSSDDDGSDNDLSQSNANEHDEHGFDDPGHSSRSVPRRSVLMSISGSFENLPSLTDASTSSNKDDGAQRARSGSKGRSKNAFCLPEYLQKSVYGTISRSLLDKKARAKSADKGPSKSLPDTPTSSAECENAIARLAPDMFFKTLVQDTWPHYCTPVPTMSTFNGLRLGYGLDLGGETRGSSAESRQQQQRRATNPLSSVALRRPAQERDRLANSDGDTRSSQQQAFPSVRAVSRRANGESLDRGAQLYRLPSEWSPVRNSQNITTTSNRLD